jgi:hypothetical protein
MEGCDGHDSEKVTGGPARCFRPKSKTDSGELRDCSRGSVVGYLYAQCCGHVLAQLFLACHKEPSGVLARSRIMYALRA